MHLEMAVAQMKLRKVGGQQPDVGRQIAAGQSMVACFESRQQALASALPDILTQLF